MSERAAKTMPVSFDELCGRHGELLKAQAEERLDPAAAAAFVSDAAAAGVQIESVGDRDAIRAMLNYWTGTLARIPKSAQSGKAVKAPPPETDRTTLASFDATQSPDLDEKANPFVGLAAFDDGQSDVFFGRDRVVADLAEVVRKPGIVVVSGASGTGKSSLVRAGLTGAIRADPKLANWVIAISAPGRDPLASLVAALAPAGDGMTRWVEDARAKLDENPEKAGDLAAERMGEGDLLLIVDQLEELFSLCPPDVRDDAATAIAAIAALPRAHVVVTIRDEYLEGERAQRVLKTIDLAKAEEFRIPPLDASEIRAAIAEPAARAGLVFHDGLIDRIVAEVGTDPAALPLLQYSLLQLWRKRQGNRITPEVYEAVGGPATALSNAAQQIYDGFVAQTRENTRIIFQQLVRPSLVYEFVRDRVKRGELERLLPPESIKTVIKPFVEAGLMTVTLATDKSEDRIEIAHEALIRNWDLLRRWAAEVRDRERLFLEIDAQAERWEESGKAVGYLLFGSALRNADEAHKQYRSRARVDPIANARVERYLESSRSVQRRTIRYAITAAALIVLVIATIVGISAFRIRSANTNTNDALIAGERILEQKARLTAEASRTATDEDVARQFIQMLLSRGTIQPNELPAEYSDMTEQATLLSVRGWPLPYDQDFLGIRSNIEPRISGQAMVRLSVPNGRLYYDMRAGTTRLAISQNDRSAPAFTSSVSALYRWPDLPGQPDEQALAMRGLVLGRLIDQREIAWGPQRQRAALAVNFLPLMVPMRQQGADRNRLGAWSALGVWLRTQHEPASKRVMYFTGAVPSDEGGASPPKRLWKVAVSVNAAGALVADAAMLPARSVEGTLPGRTTLDQITKVSGVDFSALKAALQRAAQERPAPTLSESQERLTVGTAASVFIHVQNVPEKQAEVIRLALAGQGFRMPPVEMVEPCVSPSQLRFFHPQDADAAVSAANASRAALRDAGIGDGSVEIKQLNLKRFPTARQGNLELWICGSTARN